MWLTFCFLHLWIYRLKIFKMYKNDKCVNNKRFYYNFSIQLIDLQDLSKYQPVWGGLKYKPTTLILYNRIIVETARYCLINLMTYGYDKWQSIKQNRFSKSRILSLYIAYILIALFIFIVGLVILGTTCLYRLFGELAVLCVYFIYTLI